MLPKLERLKEKRLFNIAFNLGKVKRQKISFKLLTLYYLIKNLTKKKDIDSLPKAAFIVSLKVDKRSTKRNLFKRRMKAAYMLVKRNLMARIKDKISVLIWIAHPNIKDATFEQIKTEMQKMIEKI